MSERKEWFAVDRPAHGKFLVVRVTIQEGNLTAKWSVQAFSSSIKKGLVEAKAGAERALAELKDALAEMEES